MSIWSVHPHVAAEQSELYREILKHLFCSFTKNPSYHINIFQADEVVSETVFWNANAQYLEYPQAS